MLSQEPAPFLFLAFALVLLQMATSETTIWTRNGVSLWNCSDGDCEDWLGVFRIRLFWAYGCSMAAVVCYAFRVHSAAYWTFIAMAFVGISWNIVRLVTDANIRPQGMGLCLLVTTDIVLLAALWALFRQNLKHRSRLRRVSKLGVGN